MKEKDCAPSWILMNDIIGETEACNFSTASLVSMSSNASYGTIIVNTQLNRELGKIIVPVLIQEDA